METENEVISGTIEGYTFTPIQNRPDFYQVRSRFGNLLGIIQGHYGLHKKDIRFCSENHFVSVGNFDDIVKYFRAYLKAYRVYLRENK